MSQKIISTNQKEWYKIKPEEISKIFHTNLGRGLVSSRVRANREKFGQNLLQDQKTKTIWEIFLEQFKSPLIYVLFAATLIVFLLGDYVEAAIIFSILIINAVIGAIQEGKAQNTFATLRRVVKSYATVVRNGEQTRIPDYNLVPGDIILLKDGEMITADARLFEANSLKVNESSLTGEAEAVIKTSEPIAGISLSNSEQRNMVFRGTHVVSGIGKAVVVQTGSNTVIGKIASQLLKLDTSIPLKKNIDNLSKVLVATILLVAVATFLIGVGYGRDFEEMFLTVVALAVSAIPEGLPVVVTVVLATGVWRMGKKSVLVKRLQAVEALGQAKVLALDKTGTITKNQMAVEKIFVNGRYIEVSGNGYGPEGEFSEEGKNIKVTEDLDLDLMGKISTFTAIADIGYSEVSKDWVLNYGDPTEAALMVLGRKIGLEKKELIRNYPQLLEIPFETKTKHHTTINKMGRKKFLSMAGGPEAVMTYCDKIWKNGKIKKMTKNDLAEIEGAMKSFSSEGYRLLALACDFSPAKNAPANNLKGLTFVGVVGIIDAIREEVFDSIKTVKDAEIKPIMITGDRKDTAEAIGRKIGLFDDGDLILTGKEMQEMSDEKIMMSLDKISIFARVSPEDKMRIIDLYKKKGIIIAMTGDGVNDALSLTSANLGVAMGKIGTEVAKEAGDIVLLDDNFGNIVEAAEEGRNIYLTIRKSILYLLATNLGEIMVIIVAIMANLPLPIIATQIIWLNLVTEASLVVMLAFDPKEKNLLKRDFQKPSKIIIDAEMFLRMLLVALVMTACGLFVFVQYMDGDMVKAWTMTLTVLTVIQWYNIFNIRSAEKSIFQDKIFNNKYLVVGLLIAIALHVLAVYTPFLQSILKLTAISWNEWLFVLGISLSVIFVEEVRKLSLRMKINHRY